MDKLNFAVEVKLTINYFFFFGRDFAENHTLYLIGSVYLLGVYNAMNKKFRIVRR